MREILNSLGISDLNPGTYAGAWSNSNGKRILKSFSPIDNSLIASISCSASEDYEKAIKSSIDTFKIWREVPAPQRGEIVRKIGLSLRDKKSQLGELVSIETGKIIAEGLGEIQEAIDVADFAVGLSRQLYGKVIASERKFHKMLEQWHPVGPVGIITAFNFPAAVWAWNSLIAAVCGDTTIWKPSEFASLTALAMMRVCSDVATKEGFPGLFNLVVDDGPSLGRAIAEDKRIPLVSATGSCRMGRSVSEVVARRFGKSLLELGGNNSVIVLDDADLDLAVRGILFGAVGTAGQRCTSIRRLLVHKKISAQIRDKLVAAYKQVKIGDPTKEGVLMGPLIHEQAVKMYENALIQAQKEGGEILFGGKKVQGMPSNLYVQPTIVRASRDMSIVREETFAPILYLIEITNLDEAIEINNEVTQGLSSAIFTKSIKYAERFLSASGSDCGIANVNIGTSGAEIGGAFGGEKDTGGGRESGSDSWKQYMRRQTVTVNYGDDMPLAQGIKFG